MANLYTADHHFNHQHIINDCLRPWKNVWAMNAVMIERWNEVVKLGDLVYHIGDFAFPNKGDGADVGEILTKLNGQIWLVLGNHDDKNINLFKDHPKIIKMDYLAYVKENDGQKIMLCHYPMVTWRTSCHGSWHLHGHSHGTLYPIDGKSMDIGVDTHNFYPYTYNEIKTYMANLSENWDLVKKEE